MQRVNISTITPVFRGVASLEKLVNELSRVRTSLEEANGPLQLVESIFVDDGSEDGSAELLARIFAAFPWVRVVTLSRNFGQHPATVAGILHSCGDWVITLDEDLQHRPDHILEMIRFATSGNADIVYASPVAAVHGSVLRDASSRFLKRFMVYLTGNRKIILFNSFRVIRGTIARAAAAVVSEQTYFDIALGWFTNRVISFKCQMVDERYRKGRVSGYSFRKLLSHTRRLIQSSEIKGLRFGAVLGFLTLAIGFFGALITILFKLFKPETIIVAGWTSTFVLTLILGGLNVFLAGLTLENISGLVQHSLGKPKFFEVDRSADALVTEWFESSNQ